MIEPLSCGNIKARLNHADDIGILGIGPMMANSVAAAQKEVNSLVDWAH